MILTCPNGAHSHDPHMSKLCNTAVTGTHCHDPHMHGLCIRDLGVGGYMFVIATGLGFFVDRGAVFVLRYPMDGSMMAY